MTPYINAAAPYVAKAAGAALTSAVYLGRGATAKKVAGFTVLVIISNIAFKSLSQVMNSRKVKSWTAKLGIEASFKQAGYLATTVAVNVAINKAAPYLPSFASKIAVRDWTTALVGVLVADTATELLVRNSLTRRAVAWWNGLVQT